jgi:hypothetical protein
LIDAPIEGVLSLCLNEETGDEVWEADLFLFFLDYVSIKLMLSLPDVELILISGLNDILKVLLLLL